jgi:lysozyme
MNISADGLEFIKQAEGLRLKAYQDSVGVWTIGYGHTKGVKEGDTCTSEQAEAWLLLDLGRVYRDIEDFVEVPLSQGQFDALCSFVFNLGGGALQSSTLRRMLNAKDYKGAQQQYPRWCHAGGQRLAGLVKRRAGEAEMFSEVA